MENEWCCSTYDWKSDTDNYSTGIAIDTQQSAEFGFEGCRCHLIGCTQQHQPIDDIENDKLQTDVFVFYRYMNRSCWLLTADGKMIRAVTSMRLYLSAVFGGGGGGGGGGGAI